MSNRTLFDVRNRLNNDETVVETLTLSNGTVVLGQDIFRPIETESTPDVDPFTPTDVVERRFFRRYQHSPD
jgi:hypothetical protein